MLTSKQRAFLRGQAQHLDTIFQIGKTGFTTDSIKAVSDALNARELIKLRVLDTCPYSAKEAARLLSEELGCESVQVIGSKFVLFRQKDKESGYDLKNLTVL